ncbi:MAG: MBL fold metallo-hydrolase [Gemmatimonadaceae bacterium]|jgi:glyoxylase-like metal-dependent hydrolase (beta-lactamase superfamily II)
MIEPVSGVGSQRARVVTAPNPGELTLSGTNTWVLFEPEGDSCIVVDPGPADESHVAAVLAEVESVGSSVALILVTHRHADHTGAVDLLHESTHAPVRAVDPKWCRGTVPLVDREEIEVGGLQLTVIATPGHTEDSVSFYLPRDGSLVTGDTILGEGSSLIAWPDGQLGAYLDSLKRLRDIAAAGLSLTLLPGHGPLVLWGLNAMDTLIAHRTRRLEQVASALDRGATSSQDIVAAVYGLPGPALHDVVVAQVQAQLHYLASTGNARAADAIRR